MKNSRKGFILFLITIFLFTVAGCATRSISDSGYRSGSRYGQTQTNPFYKGELSEFDVLGIDPDKGITDADIQNALANHKKVNAKRGSSVMLIQSGAMMPDAAMTKGMERYYKITGFSGVPVDSSGKKNYSKTLRFAAAKGGYETIICYWGLLETSKEGLGTKAVTWVPFVGGVLPDETQRMRIKLKVAVIDVKSGSWDMFAPEPFDDSAISGKYSREFKDQEQVAILKAKAYEAAVDEIVKRYAN